jgi:uncharacterized protein (DUF433 family)
MATPLHPLMTDQEFLDHLLAALPQCTRAEILEMLEFYDGGWIERFGDEPDTEAPPD